jgi:hypothetical protein
MGYLTLLLGTVDINIVGHEQCKPRPDLNFIYDKSSVTYFCTSIARTDHLTFFLQKKERERKST